MPFFPVEIEFTRQLSSTDVAELEVEYIAAGTASTAGILVQTTTEGQRQTPLEIEFTGRMDNVDVPLMVAAVDEIPLDDTPDRLPTTFDDVLVQWIPVDEDVIQTAWIHPLELTGVQDPIGPEIDEPDDYICFVDIIGCETYLTGINEMQVISLRSLQPDVHDGNGFYRLTFNGESTSLISVNEVDTEFIKDELEALPSVGLDNVAVRGGPL